jgi:hypothetical protein
MVIGDTTTKSSKLALDPLSHMTTTTMTTPDPASQLLTWEALTLAPDPVHGRPLARSSHGLSVLQQGALLFLHGGEHVARTPLEGAQTTWLGDLTAGTWEALVYDNDCAPSPRIAHAQAVHETTVYIFGGRTGVDMHETALNDIWAWSAVTKTWTQIVTTNGPPPARSFHRMLSSDDSLYVFGGCGAAGRLADLHRLDLPTRTWRVLAAADLRGRGGPNFLKLPTATAPTQLLVWAGFCGEESRDGQVYDTATGTWQAVLEVAALRPRSVCVAATLESHVVLFGGEVNPSDRGHEGAGGFSDEIVLLGADAATTTTTTQLVVAPSSAAHGPVARGWSAGDSDGIATLYLFGGLTGDDVQPVRLDDLWKLTLKT